MLRKRAGPAECAGPLGNLLEGSKLWRKVKSKKKQSKKDEVIGEQCQVI